MELKEVLAEKLYYSLNNYLAMKAEDSELAKLKEKMFDVISTIQKENGSESVVRLNSNFLDSINKFIDENIDIEDLDLEWEVAWQDRDLDTLKAVEEDLDSLAFSKVKDLADLMKSSEI